MSRPLEALRHAAAGLTPRPPRPVTTVVTGDAGDEITFDGVLDACTALRQLDTDLIEHYGGRHLVEDTWRAAYARRPEVLDADEVAPEARINREIVAAMLGTPEHDELRRATAGDAYAAAIGVLTQGPALRRMLHAAATCQATADQARQASAAADRAAGELAGAVDEAARAVREDGVVPEAETGEVEQAVAAARATAQAAADADQALADALVSWPGEIRHAARASAQQAVDEITAEQEVLALWGAEPGELARMDPDARMRLSQRLRGDKLRRFAELVGRFAQMATAQRSRRVEHAQGEYVGVTLGEDLNALVGAELANLAHPALRAQFAARLAERQLAVFDQRGEEREAQGGIVVCLDCSYSMEIPDAAGTTGEAYAKALALALLDQARAATPTREYTVILFAETVQEVLRFPAAEPVTVADRADLAERFPGGGTDFQQPLDAAMRLVAEEFHATGRDRADIVFVTDGVADVDDDWLRHWRAERTRLGFRCFGVELDIAGVFGTEQASVLHDLCDDVRRLDDLTDAHGAAELYRLI